MVGCLAAGKIRVALQDAVGRAPLLGEVLRHKGHVIGDVVKQLQLRADNSTARLRTWGSEVWAPAG